MSRSGSGSGSSRRSRTARQQQQPALPNNFEGIRMVNSGRPLQLTGVRQQMVLNQLATMGWQNYPDMIGLQYHRAYVNEFYRHARFYYEDPEEKQFPVIRSSVNVKIGRPGYRVTKQYDPDTKQRSLLFQIEYPEIEDNAKPRHRFMSSYEQKVQSYNKAYQYLLFAVDPYEIISFEVPSTEIDKSTPKFFSHWDSDTKMFTLQLYFKVKPPETNKPQSTTPAANGTAAPPPQGPPPPPPSMPGLQQPPPPPMGNEPRPIPPGGVLSVPPPPPAGSGTMANFTPGAQINRPPPPMAPPQGFPGQLMQSQDVRPLPPPPPNMG